MRWMLAVDTCGAAGGVAVVELLSDDGLRVAAVRELPGRETQERLMLALDEALLEAAISAGDLHVLGVVTGPGSFTGVRIGLAAVKGLAEALEVPVVAVSRLAVLAAQVGGDAVQAWVDAGRGDVFVGRYAAGVCLGEAMVTGADALAAWKDGTVVVMEAALAERVPGAVVVPAVRVVEAVPLMAELVRDGAFADVAQLDANYLRVPDAELARLRAVEAA